MAIRFCEKCKHHYSNDPSAGRLCPFIIDGQQCGCDCNSTSSAPLLMTCAPPVMLTTNLVAASPASAPMATSDLENRIIALETLVGRRAALWDATFSKQEGRIRALEDQIGKIPPLLDRIAAMEKTLARLPSLNPSIVKGIREQIDWTKSVSDEEDLLEEGYRGWPVEKERTVF